jgi:hypothetical protein
MDAPLAEFERFCHTLKVGDFPRKYRELNAAQQAAFLELANNALESVASDSQEQLQVLEWFHILLSDASNSMIVWNWLTLRIKELSVDERIRHCIAIWDPWPHPPISWRPLSRVFQWWFEPETKWAVLMPYEMEPERLRKHFWAFSHRPEAIGLRVPHISDEEFEAWRSTL